jgi:F-type H+-transporting ATPase subunit delta
MKDRKVASRYAVAALDSIKDKAEMEKVGADLKAFASLYSENAELRKVLAHPGVSTENKRNIVAKLGAKMSFSPKTSKTLDVVLKRGRMELASDISEHYSAMLDERLGRQTVLVSSAFPLTDAEKAEMEKLFSSITGRKAALDVSVDKSLIGGVVARVGGMVYDGCVRNQLKNMKIKAEV